MKHEQNQERGGGRGFGRGRGLGRGQGRGGNGRGLGRGNGCQRRGLWGTLSGVAGSITPGAGLRQNLQQALDALRPAGGEANAPGHPAAAPPKPAPVAPMQESFPVPVINAELCTACGLCQQVCAAEAITIDEVAVIDPELCISCEACLRDCPEGAVELPR